LDMVDAAEFSIGGNARRDVEDIYGLIRSCGFRERPRIYDRCCIKPSITQRRGDIRRRTRNGDKGATVVAHDASHNWYSSCRSFPSHVESTGCDIGAIDDYEPIRMSRIHRSTFLRRSSSSRQGNPSYSRSRLLLEAAGQRLQQTPLECSSSRIGQRPRGRPGRSSG
jgi:hypothetical protein